MANLGDTDGDGVVEVAVGAPYGGGGGTGAVYVYSAGAGGLDPASEVELVPAGAGVDDQVGAALVSPGDLDGDGYGDTATSAPYNDNKGADAGAVWVYLGSNTGWAGRAAHDLADPAVIPGDTFGAVLGAPGDVDGDGLADLAVGSPGVSATWANTGAVYLYFGGVGGADSSRSVRLTSPEPGSNETFGYSLSGADLDGDGDAELVVGQRRTHLYDQWVYPGGSRDMEPTAPLSFPDDGDGGWVQGYTALGVPDIDGDGTADLLVSDHYDGVLYPDGGAAWLVRGWCDDADGDAVCPGRDCDDTDATITLPISRFLDEDGDSFGGTETAEVCPGAAGYADVSGDCDDTDATLSPGATERCDADDTDEDCDGLSDDSDPSASGFYTFYLDLDGDGAAGSTPIDACDPSVDRFPTISDCDDTDPAVSPSAAESCDAADTDEDCDGLADDTDPSATGMSAWYQDDDADGYGAGSPLVACDAPGWALTNDDCDDHDPAVAPAATEICDLLNTDEDCDGLADDADPSVTRTTSFYLDMDLDNFGAGAPIPACEPPSGTTSNNADCDDADPNISPLGIEQCDPANADEDCDGSADDADPGVFGQEAAWDDLDEDGAPGPTGTWSCENPVSGVTPTDCDDMDPGVYPGAIELCDLDLTDEDCDGLINDADPDVDGRSTFYVDADGDGRGAEVVFACVAPDGTVGTPGDCDDADPGVHPGATEVCDAGLTETPTDEDCDGLADDADPDVEGQTTFYQDTDGDGFGAEVILSCVAPTQTVETPGDCDDADPSVFPGSMEICDPGLTDEDCDGLADDADPDVVGQMGFYADNDGDGAPGPTEVWACEAPAGSGAEALDCDDGDAAISPFAQEQAGDGVDQDCDGEDLVLPEEKSEPEACGCASSSTGGGMSAWLVMWAFTRRRFRRSPAHPGSK